MSGSILPRRFGRDESGATAMEYGLVMPLLIFGILGAAWAGLLMYSAASLDLAVQSAARCMAVDANNCGTASATQTYAQARYQGPAISPTFLATASGCGHTVTAQASFGLEILPGIRGVPLSSSACYP
jgi:Flp pilus assembly protein TadG